MTLALKHNQTREDEANERMASAFARAPQRQPSAMAAYAPPPNQMQNVGDVERALSLAGGAALLWYGVQRGSWSGLLAGLVGADLLYRGYTGYCVVYDKLGVQQPTDQSYPQNAQSSAIPVTRAPDLAKGIHVRKSVTVNRPLDEVYDYWRTLENLPNFMHHVQTVQRRGEGQSHWVVNVAPKLTLEWDAQITQERKNEVLAWHSLPGATVENSGEVRFRPAPGQRGTEVHVVLAYRPPGGIVGEGFARLFKGVTEQQIKEDIRRFKNVLEAGEFPTIADQPRGT